MSYITYRLCELHTAQKAVPVQYSVVTHEYVVVDSASKLGYRGSECEAIGCTDDAAIRITAHTERVRPVTSYTPTPVVKRTGSFAEYRAQIKAEREAEARAAAEAKAKAEAELIGGGLFLAGLAAVGAAKGAKAIYKKYA